MGGGLYFYYMLQKEKWGSVRGGIVLFIAFLLIGWSVVTRQSNLLPAIILALHYAVIRIHSFIQGDRSWLFRELPPVLLGAGLSAAALLLYNNYVFGSPLDYGYNHTLFPVKFAYEYLGQVDPAGSSIPLNIIVGNLKTAPLALLEGFPALVVFIPALVFILWRKFARQPGNPAGRWAGIEKDLPWGTLVVMIGWFLSVYLLYLMYEFTAEYLQGGTSFFRYSRYYLPGLFPIALIGALAVARLPKKLVFPIMFAVIASGIALYLQVALNINA